MQDMAIQTNDLTKEFDGVPVVDRLSLSVPAGSVFGLMGPNGAGKSTLIRMLLGLLHPTSGTGTILGQSILDPSGEVRGQVGYVADAQTMYPFFRVEQIIEFCSRVYPNWDSKRCNSLLNLFELPRQKWVRSLSKGMKTQLALLIALSMRPRVLILDEPTSGLDPVMKQNFRNLILQEAATGDTTIFFSTHHLHDLERMADQVALLMNGRLLLNQTIDELKLSARKIQVVFPDGLPNAIRTLPQLLKIEEQGKIYSLVVGSQFEQVAATVQECNPVYSETLDLGLEELFIHTVGKEGYSLETFVLE